MNTEPIVPTLEGSSSTPDDVIAMYERMKDAGRTWVVGMNLFDLQFGPNVYDEGLHGNAEHPGHVEPGYREAFGKALDMRMKRNAEPMDFDEYMRLHATIVPAGIREKVPNRLRNLENKTSHFGFEPTLVALSHQYARRRDLVSHDTERKRICLVPRSESYLEADITRVLHLHDQAMEEIGVETGMTAEEKRETQLHIIAACHQYLEFLHATIDCNTRRHLVMLSGWLKDIGMPPPILMHSAFVICSSPGGWADLITWGSRIFRDMSTMTDAEFAACCQAPPSMTKGTLRSFHYKPFRRPAFLEKLFTPQESNVGSELP